MWSMLSNVRITLKETLPTSAGTGDTFYIFETWIVAENASVAISNKSSLERMTLDIDTNWLCTIVLRWLDNTSVKTEVSWNKVEWWVGSEWYITVFASDIFDTDNTDPVVMTSPRTFNGAIVMSDSVFWSDLSVAWAIAVEWKSNPFPVVADDAARDILYPTPVTGDMCNNWWEVQKYNTLSTQWETLDVGTPVPQATESVAGKARLATDAEVTAGTDDETIITPAKLKVNNLQDQEYYTGEDLTAGEYVFVEDEIALPTATNEQNIWDVTANTRVSRPIFWSWNTSSTINLALAVNGSPSVDLWVRIETDNDWSPSGTLADPNATATVAAADLTTGLADTAIAIWSNEDKATGVTYDVSWSITYKTGYKVSFDKWSKINSITKDSSCTATTCYLMDSDKNILDTQTFSTDDATFNYAVTATDYYIMVDSGWSAYTSESKNTVSFPIDSEVVDYDGGILSQNAIENDTQHSTTGTASSVNWWSWFKIVASWTSYINKLTVTRTSVSSIRILNSSWTVIISESTWWEIEHTLSSPVEIVSWETYIIEWYYNWSNDYLSWAVIPQSHTSFNITWWTWSWADDSHLFNIKSIETVNIPTDYEENTNWYNISSMNVVDWIALTEWTKYHIVTYQGTYWTETVNASNYYKIGYGTTNTSTRGMKKWDWSSWDWWQIVDAHWVTLSDSRAQTVKDWIKITVKNEISWFTVNKQNWVTATKCYLQDSTKAQISVVDFVGDVATFTDTLIGGLDYYILADSSGWSYTENHIATGVSYPYVWTNLDFIGGIYNWVDNTSTIYNIESIAGGNLPIYTDKRIYTSSDLFLPNLLSKTDATYSYKIDRLWSAKSTALIGTKPTLIIDGIDLNQTDMTYWDTMYLSDTPWAISSTAGTNEVLVWEAKSATDLSLYWEWWFWTSSVLVSGTVYLSGMDWIVSWYGSSLVWYKDTTDWTTQATASSSNVSMIVEKWDYYKVTGTLTDVRFYPIKAK